MSTMKPSKCLKMTLLSVTALALISVMVGGFVIVKQQQQQRAQQRPIQLDLVSADAGARVCINGFSYKLIQSDPTPLFGGGVEILELEQEPKGEILFGPDGKEKPRRNGPKTCAVKA